MSAGARPRTLVEQWRAYGERRPLERWVSRFFLLVGVAVGVLLTLALLGLAAAAVRGVWRLLVG